MFEACLVPSTADGKVSTLFIETENSDEFILANLSLKNFNETLDISFNKEEKICFRVKIIDNTLYLLLLIVIQLLRLLVREPST